MSDKPAVSSASLWLKIIALLIALLAGGAYIAFSQSKMNGQEKMITSKFGQVVSAQPTPIVSDQTYGLLSKSAEEKQLLAYIETITGRRSLIQPQPMLMMTRTYRIDPSSFLPSYWMHANGKTSVLESINAQNSNNGMISIDPITRGQRIIFDGSKSGRIFSPTDSSPPVTEESTLEGEHP